jgi:hypothetical protein
MVFTILLILFLILEPILIYRIIKDIVLNRSFYEYRECHILEYERLAHVPQKLHRIKRKQAIEIAHNLCANLSLPQPEIKIGFWKCKGIGVTGTYSLKSGKAIIYINCLFSFNIATLVHEIAHHHSALFFNNFTHDVRFLDSEGKVFDSLKLLIDFNIIQY